MDISTIDINSYFEMSVKKKYMYVCEKLQNLESDLNVKISDGQIFIYDNLGLEFIYVPEGEYIQGLTYREHKLILEACNKGIINAEELQPLKISHVNDILVTRTPITYSEIERITMEKHGEYGCFPAYVDKNTVNNVCNITGYRILSESEWEYIARAGRQELFTFGDYVLDDKEMNKWLSMDFSNKSELNANRFGFIGLFSGDWCNDYYKCTYNSEITNDYVIRGGGALFWPWQDEEWIWCMSAMRMPSSDLIDGRCSFHLVLEV